MVPILNPILFFFSTLFGVQTIFVSEQTTLAIDLENKTARITYYDIMVSQADSGKALAGMMQIDTATAFSPYSPQVKLTSKNIYKKDNKFNAEINFTYTDQNALMELIYFWHNETAAPVYRVLPAETVVETNGKIVTTNEGSQVVWDIKTKEVMLTLKHGNIGREEFDNRVSLLNYWKK